MKRTWFTAVVLLLFVDLVAAEIAVRKLQRNDYFFNDYLKKFNEEIEKNKKITTGCEFPRIFYIYIYRVCFINSNIKFKKYSFSYVNPTMYFNPFYFFGHKESIYFGFNHGTYLKTVSADGRVFSETPEHWRVKK